MKKINHGYWCLLFLSLRAFALGYFEMGKSGVPLSVPVEFRSGIPKTNEVSLTERYDLGIFEENMIFFRVRDAEDQLRLKMRLKGKDRKDDIDFGKYPKSQVLKLFERVPDPNMPLLLRLGNDVWASGKYRILVGDYSVDGDPRVLVSFEISSIDKDETTGVYEKSITTFDVPLGKIEDTVFPLSILRYQLPSAPAEQRFFLETPGEIPFPVIVIGYKDLDEANLLSQTSYVYVASRRDLETGIKDPQFYKVPLPFLRTTTKREANQFLTWGRREARQVPKWLEEFEIRDPLHMKEGGSFSTRVAQWQRIYHESWGLQVPMVGQQTDIATCLNTVVGKEPKL